MNLKDQVMRMFGVSGTLLFQYVVPFHFSYLGGLPIHLVLVGLSMGCNPIVGIVFLRCILVLT